MDYVTLNKKNTDILIEKCLGDKTRHSRLEENRYSIQISMFEQYVDKEAAFLDIGIRDGAFLSLLRRKGFTNLYGVDLYERSVDEAKNIGIDCEVADVHNMSLGRKFDIVMMSHVLEHCPKPNKVLDNVHNHMNDNGILFIEVPIEQGIPKPTEKDAHYYNFNSFDDFVDILEDKWHVLKKFVSSKRIKVVLRRL